MVKCKNDFAKYIGKTVEKLAKDMAHCFDEITVIENDRRTFTGIGCADGWKVDVYFNPASGIIDDIQTIYYN